MTKRFEELSDFIRNQMRMSHVYQPVMLIELLRNGGKASVTKIAKAILSKDTSQIKYYEDVTKNTAGKVLTDKRGITTMDNNTYSLKRYEELTTDEIKLLINLCIGKIDHFVAVRGDSIWPARAKYSGHISDEPNECIFCDISKRRIVSENELCYAIRDLYPVTKHHTLVIPKRHVPDFFDLHTPERNAAHSLLDQQRTLILENDQTVTGFNSGTNSGEDAGQSVFHCHIHLIPRRKSDTGNPRGGVRGVIPDKQFY